MNKNKKEIEEIAQNVKTTSESLAKERQQLEVERSKIMNLKEDIDHSRNEFEKQIQIENELLEKRKHENEITPEKQLLNIPKEQIEEKQIVEVQNTNNDILDKEVDISEDFQSKHFNKDILEDVSPIVDNLSVSEKKDESKIQFSHQEEVEVPLDFDEIKRSPTDEEIKFFNENNEQLDKIISEETYLYDPSNFLNDEIYKFNELLNEYKVYQIISIPEESKYIIVGCEIIEKDSNLCLKLIWIQDNNSKTDEHLIFLDELKTILKLISSKDVISHERPIKLLRDFKEYVRQFIFSFVIYNNPSQAQNENKEDNESVVIKCSTKGILKDKLHIKFMKKEWFVVLKYLHDKTFKITLYIVNSKDGTFSHGIGIDLKCDNTYYNKFKEIDIDSVLRDKPNFDKAQFVISHEPVESNFILDLKNSIKAIEKYANKYHSTSLNAFVYGEDRTNLINQIRIVSDSLDATRGNHGAINDLHSDRKQLWSVRDDHKNKKMVFVCQTLYKMQISKIKNEEIERQLEVKYEEIWKYFGVDVEYWDRTDIKMFAYMLLDSMTLEAPTLGIKSTLEHDPNAEEEVHIKLMDFETVCHSRHILNIEDEPIALTISLFGNSTKYLGIKAVVFNRRKLREDGVFLKVDTDEWKLSDKEIAELPKAKRKDKLRYYFFSSTNTRRNGLWIYI